MGITWTEEQKKVIELRDRNILVSAAAGSGKTAVLVERIVHMLTRKDNPVDVDCLLIVTFTEAAAAEMKERIRTAIENQVEKHPEDEHLNRQATLIHSARITTIHSFCLSVIREHFHTIDLDPAFRIGEEGELKLLRNDVMDELLEDRYVAAEPDFLNLVEAYGGTQSDEKIAELIQKLYEFSRSYPDPEEWLDACVEAYDSEDMEAFQENHYYQSAMARAEEYLNGARQLAERSMEICGRPDGPYMYEKALQDDQQQIFDLVNMDCYEDRYKALREIKWKRLAANRDEDVSETAASTVKDLRDEMKGIVTELKNSYYALPPDELVEEMQICRSAVQMLVDLTKEFARRFEETKRARNLIDFDDMQQYAMRILTRKEEGKLVPSKVAEEYQQQFYEIMIDEYQDSNLIQEAILMSVSRMSQNQNNVFMVGDVKQSIYRFRLSRPELFMDKYETYSLEDGDRQRIDLHKNFRSRKEVIDGVNDIFRQIMGRSLGGVEYDDRAALYPGASYPNAPGNRPELILVDTAEEEELEMEERLSTREKEAAVIAARIRKLLEHQQVTDKKTGKLRPAEYRDIVILTRSMKGYADVYTEVLAKDGIPVHAGTREGYFETREIGLLLDYLRVLNNRQQDVPLAAVLRSVFGGITDEELAVIKGTYRKERFWKAVLLYAEEGDREDLREKLSRVLNQMETFRRMIPHMALHRLLERIVQETGYRDYVAALPAGEQREANLNMLLEKAKAFESTSYKGVFHFVRYIEQLKKYEIEYGEANTVDEQSNTVRLMSIHKSKGLEFPIVIVAGMGKQFNRQDSTGDVLIHADLGIGLECINLETREKSSTFIKNVIAREEELESMGEELRVLYVALTRAKEKLIIIGTIRDPEKKLEEQEVLPENDNCYSKLRTMSFQRLATAKHYLDWIIPAVGGRGYASPFDVYIFGMDDIQKSRIEARAEELWNRRTLENWNTEEVYDAPMQASLEEQFAYQYPYRYLEGKKLKYTVSELKKRAYLAEEAGELLIKEDPLEPLVPKFLQEEEELSGASRGTAYHRVMELLDFTRDYSLEEMRQEICQMKEQGRIPAEAADVVSAADMVHFLETNSGKRMQQAATRGRLWKEQPFVLGIPAQDIYPELQDLGEMMLVQGIIDVYFEEDGELVVLDYKTDRVYTEQKLLDRYQSQLEYYARALEQITEKKVREKIIYSFTMRKEIAWE